MLSEHEKLVRRAEYGMAIAMAGEVIRRRGGSTAIHEAAHAVVAISLGQSVEYITIVPAGKTLGHMKPGPRMIGDRGPIGVGISGSEDPPRDLRQAVTLAYLATLGPAPLWKETRRRVRYATSVAKAIIACRWRAVQQIAERLESDRTLTGLQVREIYMNNL
jgi:hypothetical protein